MKACLLPRVLQSLYAFEKSEILVILIEIAFSQRGEQEHTPRLIWKAPQNNQLSSSSEYFLLHTGEHRVI